MKPGSDHHLVTALLSDLSGGDQSAAERLLPLVYDELRGLAGSYLVSERVDHTLQPTALVHEAFLRLVRQPDSQWEGRRHFYRVAALAMRRVLVNYARDRKRVKRGKGVKPVSLDHVDVAGDDSVDVVALDEALLRLGAMDARKEQVVQLRYFGGFSIEETASILEISIAQVNRDWSTARAFLLRELGGERNGT